MVRAIGLAIVAAGVAWTIRRLDVTALGEALADARLWPVLVAATINFGLIACKAVAWRALLGQAHPVPLSRLVSYTITSCAASTILPLRAGELVRLWLLRDRDGVPMTRAAAVALAEKLLDVVAMLIVVAPMPFLIDGVPASIDRWIAALAACALAAMVGLRLLGERLPTGSWLGRLRQGMLIIHRPRVFLAGVSVLTAGWLIDLAMLTLVIRAFGIDLPIGGGLLVLFVMNVTIAVPSTPGQVGALEVGAVIGLHLLGVRDEKSLAIALTYHALQVIPIGLAGMLLNARALVSLARDRSGRRFGSS